MPWSSWVNPASILGGVLERHPDLKILAVHGGGYLPAYSGRIDHAWGARSDSHGELPHPPTTYLKKIYFDTVVFTPQQLRELVRLFGADHIIMGTDYPFDMGEYDPIGHLASVEEFDVATIAVWDSPAAIAQAKDQVAAFYQRIGFDMAATIASWGVTLQRSICEAPAALQ